MTNEIASSLTLFAPRNDVIASVSEAISFCYRL